MGEQFDLFTREPAPPKPKRKPPLPQGDRELTPRERQRRLEQQHNVIVDNGYLRKADTPTSVRLLWPYDRVTTLKGIGTQGFLVPKKDAPGISLIVYYWPDEGKTWERVPAALYTSQGAK